VKLNSPNKICEDLAYWYFRLNGFLTIQNFIVHPDEGHNQKTEIDIIGIRFPNRQENYKTPMKDDKWLSDYPKPLIVLVEVKNGACSINDSWLKGATLSRLLDCIGAISQQETDKVVIDLLRKGVAEADAYMVTLVAVGSVTVDGLIAGKQLILKDVARFIHARLTTYEQQKVNHHQWSDSGKTLWRMCIGHEFEVFWKNWLEMKKKCRVSNKRD